MGYANRRIRGLPRVLAEIGDFFWVERPVLPDRIARPRELPVEPCGQVECQPPFGRVAMDQPSDVEAVAQVTDVDMPMPVAIGHR